MPVGVDAVTGFDVEVGAIRVRVGCGRRLVSGASSRGKTGAFDVGVACALALEKPGVNWNASTHIMIAPPITKPITNKAA